MARSGILFDVRRESAAPDLSERFDGGENQTMKAEAFSTAAVDTSALKLRENVSFRGTRTADLEKEVAALKKRVAALESQLDAEKRKYGQHMERYQSMTAENLRGVVYNPENLIADHKWGANQAKKNIESLEKELNEAKTQLREKEWQFQHSET